jgi:hypothetical protein
MGSSQSSDDNRDDRNCRLCNWGSYGSPRKKKYSPQIEGDPILVPSWVTPEEAKQLDKDAEAVMNAEDGDKRNCRTCFKGSTVDEEPCSPTGDLQLDEQDGGQAVEIKFEEVELR